MSWVTRLLSGKTSAPSGAAATGRAQPAEEPPDHALALNHLKRLFAEFKRPSESTTTKDQEDKLYSMIPLFIRVFESAPPSDMTERFPDILQFCSHTSKLMVCEICKRATDMSTESASRSIAAFLEAGCGAAEGAAGTAAAAAAAVTAAGGSGWSLLTAVCLLSAGSTSMIDCMTAASLPSTFIKCLYLFFDLPMPTAVGQGQLPPPAGTAGVSSAQSRQLLHKTFMQVLTRLFSHVTPAEELARKDDLRLLFSAVTSPCPPHNSVWRKSAADVLMTISQRGLSHNLIHYIQSKNCVGGCIEDMKKKELRPGEVVEMLATLFCFLRDSTDNTQTLLDAFRSCDGYTFVTDFLLKLDSDIRADYMEAAGNLATLVGALTTCGYIELKPLPTSSTSLCKHPGFTMPQPLGKGSSVRNLPAFQVLQSAFLRANSSNLCGKVLDVISSVYRQDNANYFILEPQNTMAQFAERIHLKPADAQKKFFDLLEFVAVSLKHVPCKELISLSLLLKTSSSLSCGLLCVKFLLKILDSSPIYKEVFCEVGLMEVLVTCLHRFASALKESSVEGAADESSRAAAPVMSTEQKELGFAVMEALTRLISGTASSIPAVSYLWWLDVYNSALNEDVFRQCGGARCAHNLVPHELSRRHALALVRQLLLSNGGDDDMGTLLGLMQAAQATDVALRSHILRVLLNTLRESHRVRSVFRKASGFVSVMLILDSMHGCLSDQTKSPWCVVERKEVINLLRTVFATLTMAMRNEPANAKAFQTEVGYTRLVATLKLLGCFSKHVDRIGPRCGPYLSNAGAFSQQFSSPECVSETSGSEAGNGVPTRLVAACFILRCLYDMAIDSFDEMADMQMVSRMTMLMQDGVPPESGLHRAGDRRTWGGAGPTLSSPEFAVGSGTFPGATERSLGIAGGSHIVDPPLVVHPGAMVAMLQLIPSVALTEELHSEAELALQSEMVKVVQEVLKSERNQQVMCRAGLVHELFACCTAALEDEDHPLHGSLQFSFERLASQSLTPNDLRNYLRLKQPLCCTSVDACQPMDAADIPDCSVPYKARPNGGPVSINRVKCIVSMTTPKDVNNQGLTLAPAFTEFDMSRQGFGCLFLPSIAPQCPTSPSVAGVAGPGEISIVGGVGSAERPFPPPSGLTFSTWVCIQKFHGHSDAHPVRLLLLTRCLQLKEDAYFTCLSASLDCRDKSIVVSTQEMPLPKLGNREVEGDPLGNDGAARIRCPHLYQEEIWHHVALVFQKAGILKNSSVSVYINGHLLGSQKLHYVTPNVGAAAAAEVSVVASSLPFVRSSVCAYVGTPPHLRHMSSLVWRQGPCHLVEDALSAAVIGKIWEAGPSYVGNFQSPLKDDDTSVFSMIPEDKIIFGIHACMPSVMTAAKIRKTYNKTDAKAIAAQLSMSHHDNSTPLRVLHNSALHLAGSARSLGAVLIGQTGVHTFCPQPVAKVINYVGGMSALLGFVAMATDVDGLYAAVKSVACVLKSTKTAQAEMARIRGFQTLAMLFKKKQKLLNSHVLHLAFSVVGTIDSTREMSVIPNRIAFEDLLCDIEVWREAPAELQRSLYEHFNELLSEAGGGDTNCRIMREAGLVNKILYALRSRNISKATMDAAMNVMYRLLKDNPDRKALLRFGQFVVWTVPDLNATEDKVNLDIATAQEDFAAGSSSSQMSTASTSTRSLIVVRNACLQQISRLLFTSNGSLIQRMADEVQAVLGLDWFLVFMQPNLHPRTVVLAAQILFGFLVEDSGALARFREGSGSGGWLQNLAEMPGGHGAGLAVGQKQVGRQQQQPQQPPQPGQAAAAPAAAMLGGVPSRASSVDLGLVQAEVNEDMCQLPGFVLLGWLLTKHTAVTQLYLLLGCLLVGRNPVGLHHEAKVHLDDFCKYVFSRPSGPSAVSSTAPRSGSGKSAEWCPEASVVMLSMIRTIMSQQWECEEEGSWMREYPTTLAQVFTYAFEKHADNSKAIMVSPDFILALVATLFPLRPEPVSVTFSARSSDDMGGYVEEYVVVGEPRELGSKKPDLVPAHPARKMYMDLIKNIIIDSFFIQSKYTTVLDLVLDSCLENAAVSDQRSFQTELMQLIMAQFAAADILIGEHAAVRVHAAAGGSYGNIVAHVFYFTSRLVDKLWSGVYCKESKSVFDFIRELISQGKRRASGLSLDPMYKCLNRTVLFELSHAASVQPADQRPSGIGDLLRRLFEHRSLLFGPANFDQEFVACFVHCLLQLVGSSKRGSNAKRQSSMKAEQEDEGVAADGSRAVISLVNKIWEEMYIVKKQAIEESLKLPFVLPSDPGANSRSNIPSLGSLRAQLQEPAMRAWIAYEECERRGGDASRRETEKLLVQMQTVGSKVQQFGNGVWQYAIGRRPRKELPAMRTTNVTETEAAKWMSSHISVVRNFVEVRFTSYRQDVDHVHRYLEEEWRATERELLRERGLWGPPTTSSLDKWTLDMTEGPFRMRKKMERNELFFTHYPYRGPGSKPTKYKPPSSRDSLTYYKSNRVEHILDAAPDAVNPPSFELPSVYTSTEAGDGDSGPPLPMQIPRHAVQTPDGASPLDEEEGDATLSVQSSEIGSVGELSSTQEVEKQSVAFDDHQSILRLLDADEKITLKFKCARVQGLESVEGLLLFGKEQCYIIDGFTLVGNEIVDVDSVPEADADPVIPKGQQSPSGSSNRMCLRFAYEDMREVHKRRYLLQPIAIEIFNIDGRNILLAFAINDRNRIYNRLTAVAGALTDDARDSVAGQKRNAKMESGGVISSIMGEKSVTTRWEKGEISNFQYLMYLNTLAGRSYNDLMQYPVFPWVLADYTSAELNLCDPKTFRDFSKPMGAQTANRLEQFKKRFRDWDDPTGETPPYHYGTHYSSAMIVASYLVRMEPFTQHFLRLQGGHFDLADRMFHSIQEGWESASRNNMADVKELIPEFFYLPDFLLNSNGFDLGMKQNGTELGDVLLPPWAKGDAREFVRVHREALECDYVSAHLHEWIDLVFGYKQQGQTAVEACNVFHHLFYEGNVDIYSIDDPVKRNAIIGFINNFGQTPKQLFKKSHPQKRLPVQRLDPSQGGTVIYGPGSQPLFYLVTDTLRPNMNPIKELRGAVGQITCIDKAVLAVEQNKVLLPPDFNTYLAWSFPDLSMRICQYEYDRLLSIIESVDNDECMCAVAPNSRTLITSGQSTVVNVWTIGGSRSHKTKVRLRKPLFGHTDAVVSLAASSSYNIIVSGSRDRSCIIWDLSRLVFVRQLTGHRAAVSAICINDLTGDIATCSSSYLHLWTINGQLLAEVNTAISGSLQIYCVCMSQANEWDSRNVIMTGSSDGVVRMWCLEYVPVPDSSSYVPYGADGEGSSGVSAAAVATSTSSAGDSSSPATVPFVSGAPAAPVATGATTVAEPRVPIGGSGTDAALDRRDAVATDEQALGVYAAHSYEGDGAPRPAGEVGDVFDGGAMSRASSLSFGQLADACPAGDGADASLSAATPRQLSTAGSTTPGSDVDDFVVVNTPEAMAAASEASPAVLATMLGPVQRRRTRTPSPYSAGLPAGCRWQRQLVFKSKLTMHTAFERKDNKDPAAITALAISKDCRTVYVGDARGRVLSWSVADQPGQVPADYWLADEAAATCTACDQRFTFSERRHHCRNCGKLFCAKCSKYEAEIPRLHIHKPVRVCLICHKTLAAAAAPTARTGS